MSRSSRRRARGNASTASAPWIAGDRAQRSALRSALVSSGRSQSDYGSLDEPVFLPDDRRTHIPTPPGLGLRERAKTPAKRFSGSPARVVAPPPRKRLESRGKPVKWASPAALLFSAPQSVAVCVQRGVRREVMHATGKAGGPTRRPRPGPFSKVRCR